MARSWLYKKVLGRVWGLAGGLAALCSAAGSELALPGTGMGPPPWARAGRIHPRAGGRCAVPVGEQQPGSCRGPHVPSRRFVFHGEGCSRQSRVGSLPPPPPRCAPSRQSFPGCPPPSRWVPGYCAPSLSVPGLGLHPVFALPKDAAVPSRNWWLVAAVGAGTGSGTAGGVGLCPAAMGALPSPRPPRAPANSSLAPSDHPARGHLPRSPPRGRTLCPGPGRVPGAAGTAGAKPRSPSLAGHVPAALQAAAVGAGGRGGPGGPGAPLPALRR